MRFNRGDHIRAIHSTTAELITGDDAYVVHGAFDPDGT
jgi:hypothetical protein